MQFSRIITPPHHPGAGAAGQRGRLAPQTLSNGTEQSASGTLALHLHLVAGVVAAVRNTAEGARRVEDPSQKGDLSPVANPQRVPEKSPHSTSCPLNCYMENQGPEFQLMADNPRHWET